MIFLLFINLINPAQFFFTYLYLGRVMRIGEPVKFTPVFMWSRARFSGSCVIFTPPSGNEDFESDQVSMIFSDAVVIVRFFSKDQVVYQVNNRRSMVVQFTLDVTGDFDRDRNFPSVTKIAPGATEVCGVIKRTDVTDKDKWPQNIPWHWSWKTL